MKSAWSLSSHQRSDARLTVNSPTLGYRAELALKWK